MELIESYGIKRIFHKDVAFKAHLGFRRRLYNIPNMLKHIYEVLISEQKLTCGSQKKDTLLLH